MNGKALTSSMDRMRGSQSETGLQQNAAFIRATYGKAVITGMLAILSANINLFVDGILVAGRIGADALAAINLSLPVSWALLVIGSFLAAGTEIPAARAIGFGDAERRDALFNTGLNVSILVSLAFTAVALALLRPLVTFLGADDATRAYVTQYVMITLIGALPRILVYIPYWYLRLDGRNADVVVMMVSMTAINIALDVLFVYGMNMGVFGAGLASVIATAASCLYGMIRLLGRHSPYRWKPEIIRDGGDWRVIASAGFPSAFNNLCATVRLLAVNALLMAHGGAGLVAVFTAINGLSGFGDCVTLGVPAAGGAMLGVFSGEHDNGSCRLLLREEWRVGCIAGGVFLALCMALSGPIRKLYGLDAGILVPLLWLCLSVFPALLLSILSTCYNMAGMDLWANGLIFLRSALMSVISLKLVIAIDFSVFAFLLLEELFTMAIWWGATGIHHLRHPEDTRYLMTDLEHERSGRVLNFSVSADVEEIVSASERISAFCAQNSMSDRETMRLEMSMEEVMTLIRQVNADQAVRGLRFDLRAYSIRDVQGIRIRYSGIAFNPFNFSPVSGSVGNDMYMGVRMIRKMVETVNYQRAFGVNTLQILLKEGQRNET